MLPVSGATCFQQHVSQKLPSVWGGLKNTWSEAHFTCRSYQLVSKCSYYPQYLQAGIYLKGVVTHTCIQYTFSTFRGSNGSLALWEDSDARRAVWGRVTKSSVWTNTYSSTRQLPGTTRIT